MYNNKLSTNISTTNLKQIVFPCNVCEDCIALYLTVIRHLLAVFVLWEEETVSFKSFT